MHTYVYRFVCIWYIQSCVSQYHPLIDPKAPKQLGIPRTLPDLRFQCPSSISERRLTGEMASSKTGTENVLHQGYIRKSLGMCQGHKGKLALWSNRGLKY